MNGEIKIVIIGAFLSVLQAAPIKNVSYQTFYMEDYAFFDGKLDLTIYSTPHAFQIQPFRTKRLIYNMEAVLEIIPPKKHGLIFSIQSLNLLKDGNQCLEILKLKGLHGKEDSIELCGSDYPMPKSFYTDVNDDDDIAVKFIRKTTNLSQVKITPQQAFHIVVTSYTVKDKSTASCPNGYFPCHNGRCLPRDLVCDTFDNCGDLSDEDHCNEAGLSAGYIVLIIAGVFIILSMLATVIICRKNNRKKNSELTKLTKEEPKEPACGNYSVPVEPPTAPPSYEGEFYHQPARTDGLFPPPTYSGYQQNYASFEPPPAYDEPSKSKS